MWHKYNTLQRQGYPWEPLRSNCAFADDITMSNNILNAHTENWKGLFNFLFNKFVFNYKEEVIKLKRTILKLK